MQACLLTTFVILVLGTVAYVLSQSALEDVVRATGIAAADGERAMGPGLSMLARSITIVGALLVAFAAATAFLLARQVTTPLRLLADKVGALRPGEWQAARTVRTGDEVEVVDAALVDMAERLAVVYAHQEEEIAERTADLQRQYKLDRAILESIRYGVLAVDDRGIVTQSNPAATGMLGADADGKGIEDILALRAHHGLPLEGEHPVLSCLRTGKDFRATPSLRLSIERADKKILPIALSVAPLSDDGRVFGALVVFQDVTEERHLDYLKSEFITLASHQLRTPLSAIRWYAELLEDSKEGFTEEQLSYVTEIDHSVRRMTALLGSLLHAARMEDERLHPQLHAINLTSLVADTVRDTQEIFEGSAIRYTLDVPKEPVQVLTDPVLLRVVMQNLLGNALKYSPKGSEVAIAVRREGDRAVLTVADAGLGIPESEQDRIFEKFFRAQNVRKIDTDGNGLGLYISKSIVDRLGGTLSFVSEENKGTTFTVSLPVERAS